MSNQNSQPNMIGCKTFKLFEEEIREFLTIMGFKNCFEAYQFIDKVTKNAYMHHKRMLETFNPISENIVNAMLPQHNRSELKKQIPKLLYKIHKKVDPTLKENVALIANFYFAIYILYANFIVLTELTGVSKLFDKQEMLTRLMYMFYVKRFLSTLRSSGKMYINKDILLKVIQTFKTSHLFRRYRSIHDAIYAESLHFANKLIEKVYNEKNLKTIHTIWSSRIQPKAYTYATQLRTRYIEATTKARTSVIDYDIEEKQIINKFEDTIQAFILEKEPIEDIINYVLLFTKKQVSYDTLYETIERLHKLNKSEIENMLKSFIKHTEIKDIYISENIYNILKNKSRVLYFPDNIIEEKNISLQTITNLKIAIYLYLLAYISKDAIFHSYHSLQKDDKEKIDTDMDLMGLW